MNKIILMGYMGSGKSSVGKLLAKRLGFDIIDLDVFIEKELETSIKNIFEQKGELFFRKKENEVLNKILQTKNNCVISLGGGTPCYANNLELLDRDDTTTVYLKKSVENLFKKLKAKKTKRPLIADKDDVEMKEYIAKHLFERSVFYNQANLKINTDNKSKKEIAKEIYKLLV